MVASRWAPTRNLGSRNTRWIAVRMCVDGALRERRTPAPAWTTRAARMVEING